jgi:flagellar hook-associated protein 3 FlgL
MTTLSLSDLSQMFQLRRDTVRVRSDLATATQELSTGRKADMGRAVAGNFAPLVALDRQLSAVAGYHSNAGEAATFTDAAQTALERVRSASGGLGTRLIGAEQADLATLGSVFATEAEDAFAASVSALNVNVGGRAVFGGTATDRVPLAAADDMLAALRTAVAGETTAAGVVAAVEAWFAPGAGFDTTGYVGSADPLANFQVAEGRQVGMGIKADDPALRDQLKSLAIAAMMESASVTDSAEKVLLAKTAGQAIVANQDRVLRLQAEVGSAQARIETARVENASETTALQMARNDIVGTDPYEVATRLQNLQVQLETIYTITARLSGLSLTNYLR